MSSNVDELKRPPGGATDEDAPCAVLIELSDREMFAQERPGVVREARREPAEHGSGGQGFVACLGQDLHYALRQLQRNPGFALLAVLTLGLAIGASTAIFSVIDNVLLERFPYEDVGLIIYPRVHGPAQGPDEGRQGFSSDELLAFAERITRLTV